MISRNIEKDQLVSFTSEKGFFETKSAFLQKKSELLSKKPYFLL